uniref:Cell division protein n=1 Tax=Chromochloris zofingiensis TaxID=31302 RepID=A0A140HA27_9CHLO|nr:cell division protein [Chromochloris zofingiensis]AMO01026.1 cell division protein [Chromochloris zofingiensis]
MQISLSKFLYWRNTKRNDNLTDFKSWLSSKKKENTTLEQEIIMVRQCWHSLKFNNAEITFKQKLLGNPETFWNLITPGQFFPHKKAFMHYWVFPLIGFVVLTYINQKNHFQTYSNLQFWPFLTTSNSPNLTKKFKNLIAVQLRTPRSKQSENLSQKSQQCFNESTNSENYIAQYLDRNFKTNSLTLLNLEEKEFENLQRFYLCQLQNSFSSMDFGNFKKLKDNRNINPSNLKLQNLKPFINFDKNINKKNLILCVQSTPCAQSTQASQNLFWTDNNLENNNEIFHKKSQFTTLKTKKLLNSNKKSLFSFLTKKKIQPTKANRKGFNENFLDINFWSRSSMKGFWLRLYTKPMKTHFNLIRSKPILFSGYSNQWKLNLDEFPQKVFPIPHFFHTDQKSANFLTGVHLFLSESQFNVSNITNPTPLESYNNASLFLDNFIKKSQLILKNTEKISILNQKKDSKVSNSQSNFYIPKEHLGKTKFYLPNKFESQLIENINCVLKNPGVLEKLKYLENHLEFIRCKSKLLNNFQKLLNNTEKLNSNPVFLVSKNQKKEYQIKKKANFIKKQLSADLDQLFFTKYLTDEIENDRILSQKKFNMNLKNLPIPLMMLEHAKLNNNFRLPVYLDQLNYLLKKLKKEKNIQVKNANLAEFLNLKPQLGLTRLNWPTFDLYEKNLNKNKASSLIKSNKNQSFFTKSLKWITYELFLLRCLKNNVKSFESNFFPMVQSTPEIQKDFWIHKKEKFNENSMGIASPYLNEPLFSWNQFQSKTLLFRQNKVNLAKVLKNWAVEKENNESYCFLYKTPLLMSGYGFPEKLLNWRNKLEYHVKKNTFNPNVMPFVQKTLSWADDIETKVPINNNVTSQNPWIFLNSNHSFLYNTSNYLQTPTPTNNISNQSSFHRNNGVKEQPFILIKNSNQSFFITLKKEWLLKSHKITKHFTQFLKLILKKFNTLLNVESAKILNKHNLEEYLSFNRQVLKLYRKENPILKMLTLKKQPNLIKSLVLKNLEKRKMEKVFRTYLSSKSTEFENPLFLKTTNKNFLKKMNLNKTQLFSVLTDLKTRMKKNGSGSKSYLLNKFFKTDSFILKKSPNNMQYFKLKAVNKVAVLRNSKQKHDKIYRTRISPNTLLKRIGFIFLNQTSAVTSKNEKISNSNPPMTFVKKSKISNLNTSKEFSNSLKSIPEKSKIYDFNTDKTTFDDNTISRIEKQKYQQKKRRRKKQKLETRRRKKRKRFYPRPKWIRFHLYNKFLKTRHFSSNANMLLSLKKRRNTEKPKSFNQEIDCLRLLKSKQNGNWSYEMKQGEVLKKVKMDGIDSKLSRSHSNQLKKNSKRDKKNHILFQSQFKNLQFKTKIYRNNKQKWGSSLQDTPNLEKLTFRKLQTAWSFPVYTNSAFYKISNTVMSDFQRLCWKSYWLRSNLTPYIQRIQNKMKNMQKMQNHWYSVSILKTFLTDFLGFHLPEIHLEMNSKYAEHTSTAKSSLDSLTRQTDWNPPFFSNSNLKTLEIANTNLEQTQAFNSYLTQRKQPELFCYLNIKNALENQNYVSTFSVFQNSINIAEYNRVLYQRILNIIKNVKVHLNVNGQANARSFKQGRQRSEQTQSKNYWNQLGRQISPQISAFSLFSNSMNSSLKPFGDLPTLRVLWALNKTQLLTFKEKNEIQNLWANFKLREQKKSNKTKKFLTNSVQKILKKSVNDLSFEKYQLATEKVRASGLYTKNYTNYLRQLKFKLKKQNEKFLEKKAYRSNEIPTQYKTKWKDSFTIQPQKNASRAFHFWWSTKNLNFQSFLIQMHDFHVQNEQTFEQFILPETENLNVKKQTFFRERKAHKQSINLFEFDQQQEPTEILQKNQQKNPFVSVFGMNSLWLCAILFHICCLFSVVRIPEIRSLLKFQILLIYKISNSYLMVLFSIYELLINYKNQVNRVLTLIKSGLLQTNEKKSIFSNLSNKSNISYYNKYFYLFFHKQNAKNLLNQSTLLEITYRLPVLGNSWEKLGLWYFRLSQKNANKQSKNFLEFNSKKTFQIKKTSDLINTTEKMKISNQKHEIESFILSQYNVHPPMFIDSLPKNVKKNVYTLLFNWFKMNRQKFNVYKTNPIFSFLNPKLYIVFNLKLQKSILSLTVLFLNKFWLTLFYYFINVSYTIVFKLIDILEAFMLIIYKFLEKPAELLIEWIAQFFLLEWSSDINTFVPETFDIYTWTSFSKFSRSLKIFGPLGFIVQRRVWSFLELFMQSMTKPDTDLIVRQKKGMIFWDIWAEILIQAAEKYNINIPSLTTLKEEQELLIEKLLEDDQWNWYQSSNMMQMTPLMDLILTERPKSWWYSNLESLNSHFVLYSSNLQQGLLPFTNNKNKDLKAHPKNTNKLQIFKTLKRNRSLATKLPMIANISPNSIEKLTLFNQNQEIGSINPNDIWKRWSANQFFTYQGKDTDLFIDIHPPKSFHHMSLLKYYEPAQQTLGSLVCQIYSGIFSKQVSKNILVVGAPGTAKSLLIQALAGETELKIITDNANRYALVQRGVAVGMKLLRDVFDAIALHTPCLFLMENIHVIGERRPMLISDDENAKAAEPSFGIENEEVHEKNQLIYQLSRHFISHYKRPYKGDFSMLIPTNHFSFDLFLGVSPPRTRRAGKTPKHPFPIQTIENQMQKQNETEKENFGNSTFKPYRQTIISRLQLPSEKFFTPPATSPFTILVMKEQKKLKPRKLVKEMPWGGLSHDQSMLVPKMTYSIRIKVALLADIAISNLSVKLDMITDLLVIIDSVRSNRGFVVFATTHVPSILDPALRRPGRLDETISLPLLPNFMNRWETFQTNLSDFSTTLDFIDYGVLSANLNETEISNIISKAKLLLLNTTYPQSLNSIPRFQVCKAHQQSKKLFGFNHSFISNPKSFVQKLYSKFPIYTVNQALKLSIHSNMVEPVSIDRQIKKVQHIQVSKFEKHSLFDQKQSQMSLQSITSKMDKQEQNKRIAFKNSLNKQSSKLFNTIGLNPFLKASKIYSTVPPGPSNFIAITYYQIGKLLIHSQLLLDPTTYSLSMWTKFGSFENSMFKDLYSSRSELKNQLIFFFSGKISEFFVFNSASIYQSLVSPYKHKINLNSRAFSKQKFGTTEVGEMPPNDHASKCAEHSSHSSFENSLDNRFWDSIQNRLHRGFWSLAGIEDYWRSATSLVLSLMHKRYLYNKNLLVSRMFYLEDSSNLKKPPSPPASSLLMPAKKYENLKRTERNFQQKATFSINEKIQFHQQQRLMKKLYNQPIQEYFHSEIIENRKTVFSSSFQELSFMDALTLRTTSVNCYYKNRILTRHKYSLVNQWWNGQLAEHNVETTFLSDVDWRSMFVESQGDLIIDFPDAEQFYNPRRRRWFLSTGYWGYWLSFEKTLQNEIYYHYMILCFNKTFNFLNHHREILDYFAYNFLHKGVLKEIDLVSTFSRFYLHSVKSPRSIS